MEKVEPLCTVGGDVKWCSYWKTIWRFFKKLKIELPYNPEISGLYTFPKELKVGSWMGTLTPLKTSMFIPAFFTIAERRKQAKGPKTWHTHAAYTLIQPWEGRPFRHVLGCCAKWAKLGHKRTKSTCCCFLQDSWRSQNHRDEIEEHLPQAGREARDSGLMETVSPWDEEKVLQVMAARAA